MISCKNNKEKGFTLIELIVSLSLFSIVMVMCVGSIMTIIDSNRKSQNLRSVMDNLNFTLESMTRDIRFGEVYHCGTNTSITTPLDCNAGNILYVKLSDGSQAAYKLSGSRIVKTSGGIDYYLTSPDINITSLKYYVLGSDPYPNLYQPRVIMVISGYVGTQATTKSSFTLETTVSQRKLDLQ